MKYVVVDLEMNRLSSQYKNQRFACRSEIIEIGAVALDDQYQEVDSFMTYVKPQYNPVIEKKYVKLTGITTEMVQDAPHFGPALDMFFEWCTGLNDQLQFCQWSNSDWSQITNEAKMKSYILTDLEEMMLSDWCDFQKEYGQKLGVDRALSLKEAMMYAGVESAGRQHDALYDARNTARLLTVLRTPELCEQALAHVINALRSEPLSASLGDLFDFNKIISA